MHQRIFYFLRNILSFRNKEKIVVYAICLGLSFFLWFLNTLDKNYTGYISVPVRYINLPENKQFSGSLPNKLEMMVDASGYTILQYKLSIIFSPLLLDVDELTNKYLQNKYISKYAIATMNHKESMANQISNNIKIINIRPDSIFFDVSPLIEREIKIRPKVKLSFSKEYTSKKPPFTKPDFVSVHGPKNILDTLSYINTEELSLENLSQNITREVKLDIPDRLTSKIKKVILDIPVEQFTEASFEIPVSILNVPDSLLIKTFPGKIRVSCRVGLSEYNNINKNSFKAFINFSPKLLVLNKLPIQLGRYPESIISADYTPKEVEYVIELKK